MKRIITLGLAILAVTVVAVLFYGCGNDTEEVTTTQPTTINTTVDTTMDIVTVPDKNDGMVSDVSDENNDGLAGDIVDGVSEGISEGLTDIKDALTE